MTKSIFMALWGNPLNWELTTYNFNNFSQCAVTSSSIVHRNICPDAESFIFIPNSIFPEFYINSDSINKYRDDIMKIINDNLIGKNDTKSVEFINRSNIILFPSTGIYNSNGSMFILKTDINYLYTYFYRKVLDYMEAQEKFDKLVIDMTHGINFLQFIFLESVKYSCMVYSLRHRKNIIIEYYNSSPYVKGAPISIMLIRSINISSKNVLPFISRDFLKIYKNKKNEIITYYKTLGLNVNPIYIKGCALMVLSVTVPYLSYVLSQINDIKIYNNEITLSISKNNGITEILHEFPYYYETYVENLAFFDALMALKEFIGYNNGISIKKIYEVLDLYFGSESNKIFVKSELSKLKSKSNAYQEFSEDKFSRNFKAHAGLLNNMYEIKDKTIIFKTFNHNGNKINTDWIIKKLIND